LAGKFLIGTALNSEQILGRDTAALALVRRHFNAVVAENCMKSAVIHPEEHRYNFAQADALVDFATRNGITVTGHCLIWHSQLSPWMCVDSLGRPASPELLKARMREHIHTVVGRYKGRIRGWDVVNEAILEDGSYRDTPFYRILGEEFIPLAFGYAHEADPEAELYYNDYGMNVKGRRRGVVRLIRQLKERGLRIDAVGMQGHMGMDFPDFREFEQSLTAFASQGVKVMITEWDMSALPTAAEGADISDTVAFHRALNPYPGNLPDSISRLWNGRMADMMRLFLKHADIITRVTTWGVTDAHSWRNNFPVRGRTDYPLLFDRRGQPKAFVRELLAPRSVRFQEFTYEGEAPDGHPLPLLPGCYPDPSICRVDSNYYVVNSSFAYFPGVPIWHSTDLKRWTRLGFVLNRPSQLSIYNGLPIRAGIYAPTIRYNPHNRLFYLITTYVGGGGNFFVTTDDPLGGTWSDPVFLPEVQGIDPDLFFDADGSAYLVHNSSPDGPPAYDGHCVIRIHRFDWKAGRTVGKSKIIVDGGVDKSKRPIWIEGPHLYRINGTYYLMAAEGGTGSEHSEVLFTATEPLGSYTPCALNPILTQRDQPDRRPHPITSTGHADLVQTPDGSWQALFLGVRPYRDGHDVMGRETFLQPVTWQGGQPVILPRGETLTYGERTPVTSTLWTAGGLSPEAFFIRTPQVPCYRITDNGTYLQLEARSTRIGDGRQPSAVGRWITSNRFKAGVSVSFMPRSTGDFGGLCLFQDDRHYIRFGLTMDDRKNLLVLLEAVSGNRPRQRIVSFYTPDPDHPAVYLTVQGDGQGQYSFAYSSFPGDRPRPMEQTLSADLLSTRTAGNFTGTMLSLLAEGSY
jgi:beta-xylosidase/GH35 family endo-1,4-beta-xylanase